MKSFLKFNCYQNIPITVCKNICEVLGDITGSYDIIPD
jgi:hypothetical protein